MTFLNYKRIIQILFRVSQFQANATKYLIDKISYSTYDVEVRENVSLNIILFIVIKTNHNLKLRKN